MSNGMTLPETSYWLLLLLSLLSQGVLGTILLLRENQHAKIQKGLLDRLMEERSLEPLPDIAPISDFVGVSPKEATTERIEQVIKEIQRRKKQTQPVHFNIPGMPVVMKETK
jgi:hypothetical protein